jgi:hypothetical protein
MDATLQTAVTMAIAVGYFANSVAAAEPVVLHFDELKVDDVVGNPLGIFPAGTYRKQGVVLTTVVCQGQPAVGKQLAVRQTYNGFEVIGGASQPAISAPNFVIPFGGGPKGCVVMKFTSPVTRARLTTDCFPDEARDVVRLYALKRESGRQFSIVAVAEGFDDALTGPDNRLEVQSKTPFHYALFQCTTEREGFDDLEFEPAPASLSTPADESKDDSDLESQPDTPESE